MAQSRVQTEDNDNRLNFRNKLFDKVEEALTPSTPQFEAEPVAAEIIEKYSKWTPVGFVTNSEEVVSVKKDESYIPQGEVDKRNSVKLNILDKVESSLTPPAIQDSEPIEIIEKFSTWTPACLAIESGETLSKIEIEKPYVPQGDIDKRNTVKFNNLKRVKDSLTPKLDSEPESIEIIEKYSEWVPARLAISSETDEMLEVKKDESFLPYSETEKREGIKSTLLNKVENSLTLPEVAPEPEPIEIIEKYSTWVPVGNAVEPGELLPVVTEEEFIIPQGDLDKRGGIKSTLLSKVENSLTPKPVSEPVPVEIIEKYSQWTPVSLATEPGEMVSKVTEEEFIIPQGDLDKREGIKFTLIHKVEDSLTPKLDPEPVPVEIIEKYSQWTPARIATEPGEMVSKTTEEEFIIPQGDLDKREGIKSTLLHKVEESLITPELDPEPPPIEIIEKYSTWVPVGNAVEPGEMVSKITKEEFIIPQGDLDKREGIKSSLLNKVEDSLTPKIAPEPLPVEIIEKYSTWTPAKIAVEPGELLSDVEKEKFFISQGDLDKREDLKHGLLHKVEETLIPLELDPEPVPIEIIEKYSQWTPAKIAVEPGELLPDVKEEEFIIPQGDLDKREVIKSTLLHKVEESLITPEPAPEPDPIEILDQYSQWIPAWLAMQSEEMLPEFKEEDSFIPNRELEKRDSIKLSFLNRIEESLTPSTPKAIQESTPIEIIEKYSKWVPVWLARQSDEFLPEIKKEEPFIPHREIEKRGDIKRNILDKVEGSLNSTIQSDPEPVSVEIIGKYAMGIPQPSLEMADYAPPESRRILEPTTTFTNDAPKRISFKDKLAKKVKALDSIKEQSEVSIIGYSQREIVPFSPDYAESKRVPFVISDPLETVLTAPIIEEETTLPVLLLPENYGELDERALYGVLIRDPRLKHTSESANLVMDVLSGRSTEKVELVVVPNPVKVKATPKPVKVNPVAEVLEATIEPVIKAPVKKEEMELVEFNLPKDWMSIPLSVLRTDLLATGATPEQVDAKLASMVKVDSFTDLVTETIEEVPIDLPEEFTSWKSNSQYIYLTKERKLTPEKANSIIWELN